MSDPPDEPKDVTSNEEKELRRVFDHLANFSPKYKLRRRMQPLLDRRQKIMQFKRNPGCGCPRWGWVGGPCLATLCDAFAAACSRGLACSPHFLLVRPVRFTVAMSLQRFCRCYPYR